ncbi:MAG: glycosyl transferase family 8 [Burkholderiaceae bacterium]
MKLNAAELEHQAHVLLEAGRLIEAEVLLRQALVSGSGPVPLWLQLVQAIRPQGKMTEVRAIQEMVVQSLPGNVAARFDLSETLLLLGDFERGWREYRFRYNLQHTAVLSRKVQRPRWEGQSLPGKMLLVHDEQGYGDTFQFMRMIPWVRERSGARVILEINPESLSLAQRALGSNDVIARGSLPPVFDFHCELMNLPMAMKLKLSDLPGTVPYLSADPARLDKWRTRLATLPRPLVGLVWAGRPTHSNDAKRSMTLAGLTPLAQSGITFLSLQKGPASTQAMSPPSGMSLVSLSDEIEDFEDTAAILTLIDLLISVDSSPVHLAGALGRPAWVMLPFVPDWRWLLDRNDTPWYPATRLFRQPAPDQWGPVIESIATELTQLKINNDHL